MTRRPIPELPPGDGRVGVDAIYCAHVRYVRGMVTRRLRDREDIDDCVQETFTVALEHLGSLRSHASLRAWLAQIAVNLVRRHVRRRKHARVVGLDRSEEPAAIDTTTSRAPSPEVYAELAKACVVLDRITTDERTAWLLRHVEGRALEEVAETCGCSLATAKRRIAAAEARLYR